MNNYNNKIIKSYVIKKNMNKSLVSYIIRYKKHNIYKKNIKKKIKIIVHDEFNVCNVGDYIYIKKCKNISKNKYWIFIKKIK